MIKLSISIVFFVGLFQQGFADEARVAGMVYIWPPRPILPVPRPPTPPPISKTMPVPLTSVSVQAKVRAWAYDVTAELSYINNANQTIESQFVFPMPDQAAVYKLEAIVGGRKLQAEVKNRTEAEAIYRAAVDAGQAAALLQSQQGTPDVYRIMLGNLRPNETAVVKIGYAMPIERDLDTGALIVNLPVVLNPRYVPSLDVLENSEALKKNFLLETPFVAVSDVRYSMTFSAKIDMGLGGGAITGIKPGNATDIIETVYASGNKTADVVLKSAFSQDHDFRLFINTTKQIDPKVSVEPGLPASDDAGGVSFLNYDVAAAWFEPLGAQRTSGASRDEYWLIVDRSGSMSADTRIPDARVALGLLVKSLPVGCKFNIIGFGSQYTPLFNTTVDYSDDTVKTAMSYANSIDADMGGTEILEPMQFVYSKAAPTVEGAKRFIILLTDGEVSNTQQVIDTAKKNAGNTRVFAIGIGEGASTALVNGVARVANGFSEFVRSTGDRLQSKVIAILKATTQANAENVKVSWPLTSASMKWAAPTTVAMAAFKGKAITQFAIIERQSMGGSASGSVKLDAAMTDSSSPVSFTVPFTVSGQADSSDPLPLHRLAAKARLVDLTDSFYADPTNQNIKKEAIAISIATGVLCEFTAIVAVDSETRRPVNDSNGKPLFVNIERPTSQNLRPPSFQSRMYGMPMPAMMPRPSGFSAMGMQGPVGLPNPAMGMPGSSAGSLSPSMGGYASYNRAQAARPPPPGMNAGDKSSDAAVRNVNSLTDLQYPVSGAWPMNQDFVVAVAAPNIATVAALNATARAAITADAPNAADETVATLVAVAAMRKRFASTRNEWELIEDKALSYLRKPERNIDPTKIDQIVQSIIAALFK